MPIVTIQSPQGENIQIEAPEGATDEQIFMFAKSQGLFNQPEVAAQNTFTDSNDFIPTDENLAKPLPEQPQTSLLDDAIGLGEAALTTVTGATGGALGFGLGAVEGIVGELTGRIPQGEGVREAERLASELTFAPRTQAGQDMVKSLGETLGVLPPVLGTTPLNTLRPLVTGRAVTDRLLKSSRAKKQLLVDEIRKGNPNIELVTKALNESGDIITRPASKRAVKILGGDHVAEGTVAVIENMSPASKKILNKQLDNITRGRREPLFGDANRPSNTLGESILERAIAIDKVNKKAGETIGKTADSLRDVNVDISNANNSFLNGLNELGVTFSKGDDGWVTPDFSRSKFNGGSNQSMTVLINDLLDGSPSFDSAHKLKRIIRDNIDFESGTGGVGQVKGDSKRLLQSLSSGIDEVLDSTSPDYKKANESFAKTINLKNDFDKLMGKDIDLTDRVSASSILGNKAMRVDSNAPSGVVINKLFTDADSVLGDFKIRFKDDIPSLRHITNKLNDAFKIAPPNSLKGNIVSGGLDVAEAATGNPIALAKAAAKLAKKDAPDFNKKMRAFKSLLNQQQDNK
tara:strand:- start:2220 stop:3944 length:1725 start_codon:yes stop_codon:yes gene_type:complete